MTDYPKGHLHLRILSALDRAEDCLHPTDLASTFGHSEDPIRVVLRRLESQGLVCRADRGCWMPTAKGRAYVERVRSFVA